MGRLANDRAGIVVRDWSCGNHRAGIIVRESSGTIHWAGIIVRESSCANHPGDKSPGWNTKPRERGSRNAGEFRIAESTVIVGRRCGRRGHARVCRNDAALRMLSAMLNRRVVRKPASAGLVFQPGAFMPGMLSVFP
jgi:hypothetical protein